MKDSFEELLEQFEQQFNGGTAPDIEQFLQMRSEQNGELLAELVHTELELRLRTGEQARVESYLDRFPQLSRDRSILRDLVRTEFNVRRNFDPGCRLEEYVLRFPDMRQSLVDEFLDSSSSGDQESKLAASTRPHTVAPASPSDLSSRFRKLTLHEQGGLGNVWLARDSELDREIIVKEIKSKYSGSSTHRARFARETRITCGLEHPGIVPVYGKGSSADGSPFFAMQYVQGANFRSSIEQYHHHADNEQDHSITFNRLLQHFVDVCDTVEYAHSQGVIHRDIKPENIMVGQFGETYLIDWGLAASTGERNSDHSSMVREQIEDEDDQFEAALSRYGQTIGSPAFMSPEQAKGNLATIGKGSDVYGLGTTLFSVITGSVNPNQELVKIDRSGEIPANIRQQVPHELSPLLSICYQATAPDASQRYLSAAELREDVENFLLGGRVTAHPDSVLDRWSRFLKRNRSLVGAALVSLLLTSIVSLAAAFWIDAERQDAIAAREAESWLRKESEQAPQQETLARQSAETRRTQPTNVLSLVADTITGSDDAGLLDPAEVTGEQIISKLKKFVAENDDPLVKALLNTIVARGSRSAGEFHQAIGLYEGAIENLEAEEIDDTDFLYLDLLSGLSATLLAVGDNEAAADRIDQVKAVCEKSPEALTKTYFRILLIEVKVALRANDIKRALELANEARNLGKQIYADAPSDSNMVWANYVLADLHRKAGQKKQALEFFQQIVVDQETKEDLHPLSIASAVQLAEMQVKTKPEQSLSLMEQAYQDSVAVRGPDHSDSINIKSRLGRLLTLMDGNESKQRGVRMLQECHKQMISRAGMYSRESMGVTLVLADSLLSLNDPEWLQLAVDVLNEALRKPLDESESNRDSTIVFTVAFYERLSKAYSGLGETDLAIDSIKRAIEFSVRSFGEESAVTKRMKTQRDGLLKASKD